MTGPEEPACDNELVPFTIHVALIVPMGIELVVAQPQESVSLFWIVDDGPDDVLDAVPGIFGMVVDEQAESCCVS